MCGGKPRVTLSNFLPRRSCSCPCWKSSLSNCSPITSPYASVATSTSRATWPNPSPWSSRGRFRYYRNMSRYFRASLGTLLLLLLPDRFPASHQAPHVATPPLREFPTDGEKTLTETQGIPITDALTRSTSP